MNPTAIYSIIAALCVAQAGQTIYTLTHEDKQAIAQHTNGLASKVMSRRALEQEVLEGFKEQLPGSSKEFAEKWGSQKVEAAEAIQTLDIITK